MTARFVLTSFGTSKAPRKASLIEVANPKKRKNAMIMQSKFQQIDLISDVDSSLHLNSDL